MALSYTKARDALQVSQTGTLEALADLGLKRVETYFSLLRDDIRAAQEYEAVRTQLPVVVRSASDRSRLEYVKAKEVLDSQLGAWVNERTGRIDLKLVGPDGNVAYCANQAYIDRDLGRPLLDPGGNAFREGRRGIYQSEAFPGSARGGQVMSLVTAPVSDASGDFVGVVVLEVDIGWLLASVKGGLAWSETGEMLVARQEGDQVIFLTQTGVSSDEASPRPESFNLTEATPIQMAVQGQHGNGVRTDYRSVEVLGVWRNVADLGLGLVLKVDTVEAFSILAAHRKLTWVIVLLVSIVLTAMGVFFARSISGPIEALRRGVDVIDRGKLDHRVGTDRRDEIGTLSRAFDRMVGNLSKEVGVRLQAEDELKRQTREIVKGAGTLAGSTSKVTAATIQLASATAENTVALSQATTTVEEVKNTAQAVNTRAGEVSERAQQAEQISRSGKQAAEDAIREIHRVRDQMTTIANSIARLSDQSQAIGEIASGVDDLATQSNLLAVNAAIQSAKAGEHGKGFGVVAGQIKHLAKESKQATEQIATLLSDIRNAATVAVAAAQQGCERMDSGVARSVRAGEAIGELSESVAAAAHSAGQISSLSQKQLVGMNQVAVAIDSIRNASELNSASTEQTESAALDLDKLGKRLKVLVDKNQV